MTPAFSEEERRVFDYQACGPGLRADPLELHLGLTVALGNEANQTLREARSEEPATAAAARLRLIAAVRQAFGLPPYDPAQQCGATAADCERVLGEYLDFCRSKKKPPGPSPTSSPPTPDCPLPDWTSAYGSGSG